MTDRRSKSGYLPAVSAFFLLLASPARGEARPTPRLKVLLDTTAQGATVAGIATALVPGTQGAALVFGAIGAVSKALAISLYSDRPYIDTVATGVSMATPGFGDALTKPLTRKIAQKAVQNLLRIGGRHVFADRGSNVRRDAPTTPAATSDPRLAPSIPITPETQWVTRPVTAPASAGAGIRR